MGVPYFKNEPVMVLVLGLLTCGLYLIYWNMKMATVLNALAKRELISQPIAIVAGCCVPVNAYYYYLAADALASLGADIGKEQELRGKGTMLLILGLVVPAVAAMIVQGHVNEYYTAKGRTA